MSLLELLLLVVIIWALWPRKKRRACRRQGSVLVRFLLRPWWRLCAWVADRWLVPEYQFRAWVKSDDFYQSPQWKRVRRMRFAINRAKHFGLLKCEVITCPKPYGAAEYHCHHWNPRSTHPEDALRLRNTGIACARCNVSLGNRYVGRELRPNPRLA